MSELVRKADVLPIFCMRCVRVIDCVNDMTGIFKNNCPIKKEVDDLPSAEPKWIPVSERLPEEAYPVIVTWKNDYPMWYYQHILGKRYAGVAHYKNGTWFWYSSTTEDMLMEYGKCDSEAFDEAIKVIAWMPLPEPANMEVKKNDKSH